MHGTALAQPLENNFASQKMFKLSKEEKMDQMLNEEKLMLSPR